MTTDPSACATACATPIRVLMVEDDPEAAELAIAYLTGDGTGAFQVEWSRNLSEAMRGLEREDADVVLLDLGLPELTGFRSHRVIDTVAGRSLPVVILTADDRRISRDLTVGFGAAGYLLKQETGASELRQALRSAVLGRQSTNVLR